MPTFVATSSESRYARSKELHERASRVLAGGVSSEFRKSASPHPLAFARGEGARITDVDGNVYLDFTLSQGPLILGHSHPEVLEAVNRATADGQIFAGQHLAEIELAETIQRLVPCAERMRFGLSGSEAVHAALRTARAATGRPKFLRFEGQYHGWLDGVVPGIVPAGGADWTQGLPAGVAEDSIILPWNDAEAAARVLSQRAGEIAAIITEPVMCNTGCIPPRPGFLSALRALCDTHGCLLIFDEVITGFRLGLAGAQGEYHVTPDLAVFGKALANGWPVSAVVGKAPAMAVMAQGKAVQAGTLNSGNPGIAAARATLRILERDHVHDRIRTLGLRLMRGLQQAARDAGVQVLVQGPGPMFHVGFTTREEVREARDAASFDRVRGARFIGAMQDRGIRLIARGLWYVSGAHTEVDVDQAIAAARASFEDVKG
ncbi:MAG: aminotransferase class III-fold pyridoxal phosphate-dependent enzyme [Planctomycetota bacterium]|nr:MAG: aminotransferase class III-fold pyridoxal phosphate-dependent enzyme [Planctomycetota bacterium]